MPSIKQKTHKGTKKRFKVTANGKVIHKRCGSSHLNSHKSGKQIRRLRKKSVIQTRAVNQKLRRAIGQEFIMPVEATTDADATTAPVADAADA